MSIVITDGVAALRRRMNGDILTPAAAGWDDATRAFNLAFAQEPDLVALPESERDVIEIVRYAAANGLLVPHR